MRSETENEKKETGMAGETWQGDRRNGRLHHSDVTSILICRIGWRSEVGGGDRRVAAIERYDREDGADKDATRLSLCTRFAKRAKRAKDRMKLGEILLNAQEKGEGRTRARESARFDARSLATETA